MSTLLDEIIAARKAKAIEYEEYLKRIADLAQRVETGFAEDTPEPLRSSPALRALYNNLEGDGGTPARADGVAEGPGEYTVSGAPALEVALKLDAAVKRVRPDGWRGIQAREQVIKAALYEILLDEAEVERFFVQRMKTRWGSCNHKARTIRLNTELAKKPAECLEYIVFHELVHLLEPTHNARFVALMDRFMPKWQFHRQVLNRLPVRREEWNY